MHRQPPKPQASGFLKQIRPGRNHQPEISRRRDVARHIAGAFVDGARNLPGGRLRTAPLLQRTALAIEFAGAISHHAVLIDERTRHPIDFLSLPEFLAGRADVAVAFVVIDKVVTRERAVGALGFVEDRDVRLDPPLLHQPSEILGRAVAGIAREPLGPQAEALLRAIDHPTLRGYLSLAARGARLDIV